MGRRLDLRRRLLPDSCRRMLLGKEPEAVTVQALFSPEHDDVDMMASGLIEFEGGVSLTFDCGMWAAFRNPLEVLGTEGIIEVPSAYVSRGTSFDHLFLTAGGERREIEVPHVNAYSEQADALARAILQRTPLQFGPSDAVHNMKVIDACLLVCP